jgi:branched-chain amino acid transport system permease protein
MTKAGRSRLLAVGLLALTVAAPLLVPSLTVQFATLWIMIVLALTWDILGGQMGYNSFGNVIFFGVGMYASAIVQVGLFHSVGDYTAASGTGVFPFTPQQYYLGLTLGILIAPIVAVAVAAVLGLGILGLRGHYFAIGTLGLGIAGGEFAASWEYIGGASGFLLPVFPGEYGTRALFFYALCAILGIVTFLVLRRLYAGRFGLALNAIRDDEDKAEALGHHTVRNKVLAWCVSAFFVGLAGAVFGNMNGLIEPREVAFSAATFGVWMVLMALLGGKGTLWGPVIGAVVFHVFKELFWTFLLGWQRVALGLLIVGIVLFFPMGLLGYARERWPQRFARPAAEGAGK